MGGVYKYHTSGQEGDTVWGNYYSSGYFYQATITARENTNLGRFTLQYVQADEQTDVDAENIMYFPDELNVDDEVWALHPVTLRFVDGRITGTEGENYTVQFMAPDTNVAEQNDVALPASLEHIRPKIAFQKYDTVWLEYQRGLRWYKGEVTNVNTDGTYRVHTDDGKIEENASSAYMYLMHHGRAVTAGPHTDYITSGRASKVIDDEKTCCENAR